MFARQEVNHCFRHTAAISLFLDFLGSTTKASEGSGSVFKQDSIRERVERARVERAHVLSVHTCSHLRCYVGVWVLYMKALGPSGVARLHSGFLRLHVFFKLNFKTCQRLFHDVISKSIFGSAGLLPPVARGRGCSNGTAVDRAPGDASWMYDGWKKLALL